MDNPLISFVAVGDIMLGEFPLTLGFGVRNKIESGVDIFEDVHDVLRRKDICFGNLECVLSDYNYNKANVDALQMRGSPKFVKLLEKANIKVLSIANNHIMQHGATAFQETKMLLEQAQILPVGTSDERSGKCIPQIIEIKGVKITFLGYSQRPEKYNERVLYSYGNKETIIEQIQECSSFSDIVILSLHWGDEFINMPNINQVLEAHSYIDAGASVILGHHPHILQGIERYKDRIISYSLGNFIFDFWQKELRQSMMLCIDFMGRSIVNVDIIPVFIADNYVPTILKGNDAKALINKINTLYIPRDTEGSNHKRQTDIYSRRVKILELKNKIENRLFFLSNIYRYDLSVVYKSIRSFILKRINKRSKWFP